MLQDQTIRRKFFFALGGSSLCEVIGVLLIIFLLQREVEPAFSSLALICFLFFLIPTAALIAYLLFLRRGHK